MAKGPKIILQGKVPASAREMVKAVSTVFFENGISPVLKNRPGGHLELEYEYMGHRRKVFVSASASDWRAPRRAVSSLRAQLRELERQASA
jgi:hypothetical protein